MHSVKYIKRQRILFLISVGVLFYFVPDVVQGIGTPFGFETKYKHRPALFIIPRKGLNPILIPSHKIRTGTSELQPTSSLSCCSFLYVIKRYFYTLYVTEIKCTLLFPSFITVCYNDISEVIFLFIASLHGVYMILLLVIVTRDNNFLYARKKTGGNNQHFNRIGGEDIMLT